jgi:hypothetical protein
MQNAIEKGMAMAAGAGFDSEEEEEAALDQALANVSGMLHKTVQGRIAVEVDPRLAEDAGARGTPPPTSHYSCKHSCFHSATCMGCDFASWCAGPALPHRLAQLQAETAAGRMQRACRSGPCRLSSASRRLASPSASCSCSCPARGRASTARRRSRSRASTARSRTSTRSRRPSPRSRRAHRCS